MILSNIKKLIITLEKIFEYKFINKKNQRFFKENKFYHNYYTNKYDIKLYSELIESKKYIIDYTIMIKKYSK